ncbi:MAG: SMP-30/gluconolactonase/LRE family protein [Acidimicrobiia bacterium]
MTTFEPVAWQPLPAPKIESNDRLLAAERWVVEAIGPEDVIVATDGSAIVGTEQGHILRADGTGVAEIANVGGRPLGIEWYGEDILVCNAFLGVQLVSMSGHVSVLADAIDGEPFMLTNNASVASDGAVYFTDSSTRWNLDNYVADMLEGQTTGRVLRFKDGAVEVVLDGLQFANGIALDAEEASIFVAETSRYRISRHWLKGPNEGTTEIFVDNLPGFPDNLSVDGDTLWIACASPRQGLVDFISPRPWMRSLSNRLPEALKPDAVRHGMVLGYDAEGHLIHDFQDSSGAVAITTSARIADGRLYVGCLKDDFISVLAI